MKRIVLALSLGILGLLTACSDSDSTDSTGTGGTGGTAGSFVGCTSASAVDANTVNFGPASTYAPACVRVKAGGQVTIAASMMHPLQGMTQHGDQPNPIAAVTPSGGAMSNTAVTFPSKGTFGFFCNVHGTDTDQAGGMAGVIFVE